MLSNTSMDVLMDAVVPVCTRPVTGLSPWYGYVPVLVVTPNAVTPSITDFEAQWEEDAERWDGMA